MYCSFLMILVDVLHRMLLHVVRSKGDDGVDEKSRGRGADGRCF